MKKSAISFLVLASLAGNALNAEAGVFNQRKSEQLSEFSSLTPEQKTEKILSSNDANDDGKLSKDEVNLRFRAKRFGRVDTNNDGLLDADELTESYRRVDEYNQKRLQQAGN